MAIKRFLYLAKCKLCQYRRIGRIPVWPFPSFFSLLLSLLSFSESHEGFHVAERNDIIIKCQSLTSVQHINSEISQTVVNLKKTKHSSPPFLRVFNIRNLSTNCSYINFIRVLMQQTIPFQQAPRLCGEGAQPPLSMSPCGQIFTTATLLASHFSSHLTQPCLSDACLSAENMHLCLLSAWRYRTNLVEVR